MRVVAVAAVISCAPVATVTLTLQSGMRSQASPYSFTGSLEAAYGLCQLRQANWLLGFQETLTLMLLIQGAWEGSHKSDTPRLIKQSQQYSTTHCGYGGVRTCVGDLSVEMR